MVSLLVVAVTVVSGLVVFVTDLAIRWRETGPWHTEWVAPLAALGGLLGVATVGIDGLAAVMTTGALCNTVRYAARGLA